MNKKFLLAALATAVIAFILNGLAYYIFLKDFFQSHPAVSSEFMKQLYRPDEELVIWALVASMLALGLLVTTIIQWADARTFISGIKPAFVFAFLLLCTVDFGLLASTNNFTTAGAFADLITSTIVLTICGGFAAWMLGRGKRSAS